MENLPIKTFDVLSFTGLVALLPFMVEGFKMLSKSFFTGKENWVTVILAYVIGIAVKIATPDAYNGLTGPMGWITTLVGLFLTAIAAMMVHDKVLAGMFGWQKKGEGLQTNAPTSTPPKDSQAGRSLIALLAAVVFAVALCASAMSCASAGTKTLAIGFEAESKQVFKEYNDYVIEGKPIPKFKDEDKALRREQLQRIQMLIDEGKTAR